MAFRLSRMPHLDWKLSAVLQKQPSLKCLSSWLRRIVYRQGEDFVMAGKSHAFVLSDSVGETAELVIKAGLSQFNNGDVEIHRVPYVEDKQTIDDTLQQ